MKKALRVDAEAEEEISHAIGRYDREREGLGAEFWSELSEALDTLDESRATGDTALLGPRQRAYSRRSILGGGRHQDMDGQPCSNVWLRKRYGTGG